MNSETETQNHRNSPLMIIALSILFLFLVLAFTLAKVPESRMTGLIQGYIQQALDPMGVYVIDRDRELSIIRGLRYTLTRPTIELPNQTRVELDEIVGRPHFLPLFRLRGGGELTLKQGPGQLHFEGSGNGEFVDADIEIQDLDLKKFGLISFLAGLKGSGLISGTAHVSGSVQSLDTLSGNTDLRLKRFQTEEQNLFGFNLPAMKISDGTVRVSVASGRVTLDQVTIGKPIDDIQVVLSGTIDLKQNIYASGLKLRAMLGVSDPLKQAIPLLDSLLSSARTQKGQYAYRIEGTVGAPLPIPEPTR